MLKKIIGAAIGAKLAKNSPAVGGATGAALGAAVPFVLSRISLPTMIALGVGGYVVKRYLDKQEAAENHDPAARALADAEAAATYPIPVPQADI
jgi:hypothetical protein